jgi:hypothetical protein
MVRHDWTRLYLTLVGECLEPVLNAVFVAWPLNRNEMITNWGNKRISYSLDGQRHRLWGSAIVFEQDGEEVHTGLHFQQGVHMWQW